AQHKEHEQRLRMASSKCEAEFRPGKPRAVVIHPLKRHALSLTGFMTTHWRRPECGGNSRGGIASHLKLSDWGTRSIDRSTHVERLSAVDLAHADLAEASNSQNSIAPLPPTQSSGCTREFKRRINTQTILPSADTAACIIT